METYSNKFLTHLIETNIREVAEDSKHISIRLELKFDDGNSFTHDFYIEKSMIHIGNINAMVL